MKTVLAHGVFDLLHPGHIEHLRQAREMGDRLVVSVTADEYVNKGPGRPVYCLRDRMTMVSAIGFVDEVRPSVHPSAVPVITELRPQVYAKGPDYAEAEDDALDAERMAVEALGGAIAFTNGWTMSSTEIINANMPRVSDEAQTFLKNVNLSRADCLQWLDYCEHQRGCVAGEYIEDKYIYVEPFGRSAKDSVITWKVVGEESFAGGSMALASHLKALCPASNVYDGAIRLTKTRRVELPFYHKVFAEVSRSDTAAVNALPPLLLYDFIVVVDYGHGLFAADSETFPFTSDKAPFLALTVQANSLNWGMNTLNKWDRADYIVVDEAELRLAFRDSTTPLHALLGRCHKEWECKIAAVTLGHRGCIVTDGERTIEVPALADKVVDRIGAGDAFLALTAPLAKLGAPIEAIGLVGNIAGALQVGVVGNSKPIEKQTVRKWVKALLK